MRLHHPILGLVVITLSTQILWSAPTPISNEVVKANNAFALDLYALLAKQPGNLILSPFSIDTALAMIYAGARGETARQIAEVLHLPNGNTNIHAGFSTLLKELNNTNASGCQFISANALWAQQGYPFLEPFQNLLRDQYGTSLHQTDLTGWPRGFNPAKAAVARKLINDWMASLTHDKIRELIPPTLPDMYTQLILVDAIWFKGLWAIPFNKTLTKNALFHVGSEESVSAPTMHVRGDFNYAENEDLQILELPYFSNRLSMVFFLPKKSDGLSELEKTLTASRIEQLHKTGSLEEVNVSLPKFKETSEFDLKEPLQTMGMRGAFSGDANDFSGITTVKPFFVEAAIHKAYVDVDEEGTKAAAATGLIVPSGGIPVDFNADHPFLFLIRHNATGAILFLGRVTNPVQ
jgi:serpin B